MSPCTLSLGHLHLPGYLNLTICDPQVQQNFLFFKLIISFLCAEDRGVDPPGFYPAPGSSRSAAPAAYPRWRRAEVSDPSASQGTHLVSNQSQLPGWFTLPAEDGDHDSHTPPGATSLPTRAGTPPSSSSRSPLARSVKSLSVLCIPGLVQAPCSHVSAFRAHLHVLDTASPPDEPAVQVPPGFPFRGVSLHPEPENQEGSNGYRDSDQHVRKAHRRHCLLHSQGLCSSCSA